MLLAPLSLSEQPCTALASCLSSSSYSRHLCLRNLPYLCDAYPAHLLHHIIVRSTPMVLHKSCLHFSCLSLPILSVSSRHFVHTSFFTSLHLYSHVLRYLKILTVFMLSPKGCTCHRFLLLPHESVPCICMICLNIYLSFLFSLANHASLLPLSKCAPIDGNSSAFSSLSFYCWSLL